MKRLLHRILRPLFVSLEKSVHSSIQNLEGNPRHSNDNEQLWLQQALDRLPKPFFLMDLAGGKVAYSNEAAKRMLGIEYAGLNAYQVLGKQIMARYPSGELVLPENMPTSRLIRNEYVDGEELILNSSAGEFYVKVFTAKLPPLFGRPQSALILFQDITDLKKAESQLRETQADLNRAVEIAQVGFWHLDPNTKNISVTPLLLKQFGIDPSNFKSTLDEAVQVMHPDDQDRVTSAVNSAIEVRSAYHTQYRVIHPDGEIRWIEAKGAGTYDEDGRCTRFTGTTVDVTNLVHASIEIEKSAKELMALADSMPQIVWSAEPNGELNYFNQVWFSYSGSTYEQNEGNGWTKYVHPADLAITAERWQKSLKSKTIYENQFRLRDKNGLYRWFVARATPYFDSNGKLIKWYGTNTDIHDQKILTEKLQDTQDNLELALRQAKMGLWTIDSSNVILSGNSTAAQLFDIENGKSYSAYEYFNSHVHPQDQQPAVKALETALQNKTDYYLSFRILKPNGEIRFLQSVGRGRVGEAGFVLTGLVRDVTDETLHSNLIEEARHSAERANTAKSQFLANMSHEIRTPLGAIMGFAGLLKDGNISKDERESFASVIERNSSQLVRIIDDILDLSKVEAGMMLIERIEFSLPEMLTDFSSLMGFKAREKGIGFTSKATTPLPSLLTTDPTRLRQILMNVVGNAIKFTDQGQVEMRISYRDGLLEFEVEDSGRGISPEQEKNLFQPFTQADTSTTRKFGGTGLGLVLSRSLSEALGGHFVLKQSALGQGSLFSVTIAASVKQNVKYVTGLGFETVPTRSVANVGQLSGVKILLVEDSPDNQALISIFLGRAGARTDIASDGQQGFKMALGNSYDLVLMDVQMPIMDGIAAVKKMRSEGYKKTVIALTAHAMKEEKKRCLDAGFTDFLPKPVNKEDLINLLVHYKNLN